MDFDYSFEKAGKSNLIFSEEPKYYKATAKERLYFKFSIRRKEMKNASDKIKFNAEFKVNIKEGNSYKSVIYKDDETLNITE